MLIRYKEKTFKSQYDGNILCANLDELFYQKQNNYSFSKLNVRTLNYEFIKYTSKDFCIYLSKDRIKHLSVEFDTLDLEWDKNDCHTNILETDDNEGILEFI